MFEVTGFTVEQVFEETGLTADQWCLKKQVYIKSLRFLETHLTVWSLVFEETEFCMWIRGV